MSKINKKNIRALDFYWKNKPPLTLAVMCWTSSCSQYEVWCIYSYLVVSYRNVYILRIICRWSKLVYRQRQYCSRKIKHCCTFVVHFCCVFCWETNVVVVVVVVVVLAQESQLTCIKCLGCISTFLLICMTFSVEVNCGIQMMTESTIPHSEYLT